MEFLPDYVCVKHKNEKSKVLRTPAATLTFPLSSEDLKDIHTLEAKFDQEENCAGLAAPQIGIAKRFFVFAVEGSPQLLKWRPDLKDTMPKSIWINPSYTAIGPETTQDYEGCFSVEGLAAPVNRPTTIKYEAYDINGHKIEGIAQGFLARVIQHETDHTNGILFLDKADDDQIMTIEDYRDKRKLAMDSNED
ncbi:MAG: peptide deformylase [Alphaproteobacteria bacterium]|nr:peptide deformylase [Alphaproteobacteria bacterium]